MSFRFLRLVIFVVVAVATAAMAFSQLSIVPVSSPGLDATGYPFMKTTCRVQYDGTSVPLSIQNFTVVESSYSVTAQSFTDNGDGTYSVVWRTVIGADSTQCEATVHVAYKGAVASALVRGSTSARGFIQVRDERAFYAQDFGFGTIKAGKDTSRILSIVPRRVPKDNTGKELSMMIDSITCTSPFFTVQWIGGLASSSTLPSKVFKALPYSFKVTYTAPDEDYRVALLTVHYSGGSRATLRLIAGSLFLPRQTNLVLTTQQTPQDYLPCETVPISWKGASPDVPVLVEYSLDGSEWKEIASTVDTSVLWTVPKELTNDLKIRVSQKVQNNDETLLENGNESEVTKIAFNAGSTLLVAAYASGSLQEWNVTTKSFVKSYTVPTSGRVLSLGYSSNGTLYCAVNSGSTTTLYFYASGSTTPTQDLVLPTSEFASEIQLDSTRTTLILTPVSGAFVSLRNAEDGSSIRTIETSAKVLSTSVGGSVSAVAMLGNQIALYAMPSWSLSKIVTIDDLPIAKKILLFPNAKYLAVACTYSLINTVSTAELHVVDITTQNLIRSKRYNAMEALNLTTNPTSSYLVPAYPSQPQAPLWDISTGQILGSYAAHQGVLTDLAFSPNGKMIASSAVTKDNLKVKSFVFPELDVNKVSLRIIEPNLTITPVTIPARVGFVSTDTIVMVNVCNPLPKPIPLNGHYIAGGASSAFRLLRGLDTDTVPANGCLSIPIRVMPRDTGLIQDVVNIGTCYKLFSLPISVVSLPRTFAFQDTIDLGDVCIGGTITKEIALVKNSDQSSLQINSVIAFDPLRNPFSVVTVNTTDSLKSGAELKATIAFNAKNPGVSYGEVLVYYAEQRKHFVRLVLKARAAGSELVANANPLSFIPEQRTRTVTLTNTSDQEITISQMQITPQGGWQLQGATLPLILKGKETASFQVQWLSTDSTSATLQYTVLPCNSVVSLPLTVYKASSTLSIATLQVDPRDSLVIPIAIKNSENVPYADTLPFTATLSMNSRMFLPVYATSDSGVATIQQKVDGTTRTITLTVNSKVPKDGILARIHGVAALADTDTSSIMWSKGDTFFGANVRVSTSNGKIQLTDVCGNRFIGIQETIAIAAISPNPASESTTITIQSQTKQAATLHLVNSNGETVYTNTIQLAEGTSMHTLLCSHLPSGAYTVRVQTPQVSAQQVVTVLH